MIDLIEVYTHWYAGRPKLAVAESLGLDVKTVRKYVRPAEAAGLTPGGPPVSEQEWRAKVREWFPSRYDARLVRPTVGEIEKHHAEIERLVGLVVPVSVIHQRLRDEEGLDVSVASVRRYVRGRFPDRPKSASEVEFAGPPVDPGDSAQVDYGYLGVWQDPFTGRRRRVWAFSMVLSYSRHLFIYPVLKMDQRAWVEAHVAAFAYYEGCVSRVVLDNLRTGVVKADIYDPKLNRAYAELASHYQVLLDPARPYKPKDKPRIEALQGYIRRSFFFGREFSSFPEMSAEARRWNVEVAGRRTPRALEGRTTHEVFVSEEQGALLPLPAAAFELATWSCPKVGPDAHAKVGRTLYSLPLPSDRPPPRRPLGGERRHVLLRRGGGEDPSAPGAGTAHRLGGPARAPGRLLHAHAGVVPGPGGDRRPGDRHPRRRAPVGERALPPPPGPGHPPPR